MWFVSRVFFVLLKIVLSIRTFNLRTQLKAPLFLLIDLFLCTYLWLFRSRWRLVTTAASAVKVHIHPRLAPTCWHAIWWRTCNRHRSIYYVHYVQWCYLPREVAKGFFIMGAKTSLGFSQMRSFYQMRWLPRTNLTALLSSTISRFLLSI